MGRCARVLVPIANPCPAFAALRMTGLDGIQGKLQPIEFDLYYSC